MNNVLFNFVKIGCFVGGEYKIDSKKFVIFICVTRYFPHFSEKGVGENEFSGYAKFMRIFCISPPLFDCIYEFHKIDFREKSGNGGKMQRLGVRLGMGVFIE